VDRVDNVTPFRVALIGLREAATHLHLPALVGVPDATIVGACDVDEGRRADVARRWRMPTFADADVMLADARPEVVVIGTPPHLHADLCRRALAAGAHVICEKPFVSSVAEADRLIASARQAGRQIALNHEFREMPIFRAVLDDLASPPARDVIFAQAWQIIDLPQWRETGWRGQMIHRTLYEAGVHLVDYLLALFGEQPIAVSATLSAGDPRNGSTDGITLLTLEFSRGRLAQLVQYRMARGQPQYFEVRAETPNESLRASFGGRARLSVGLYRSNRLHFRVELGISGLAWREVGSRRESLARNPRQPQVVATRSVFAKTLRAFRDGTRPPTTAEDGRNVLAVIAACYHAAARGARVCLNAEASQDFVDLAMGAQVGQ
jgi:predicted dehydrogenase